jgi:hypothetical protein
LLWWRVHMHTHPLGLLCYVMKSHRCQRAKASFFKSHTGSHLRSVGPQ